MLGVVVVVGVGVVGHRKGGKCKSRCWFQIFFAFIPTWGNDQIWRAYFSAGLVQPPTRNGNRHLSRIQTCCDVKLL